MFSSMPLTQNSNPGPSERPSGLLIEAGSPFRFLASRALSGHKLWGPRLSEGETKLEDSRARLGGPLGQAPVSAKPNYDISWLLAASDSPFLASFPVWTFFNLLLPFMTSFTYSPPFPSPLWLLLEDCDSTLTECLPTNSPNSDLPPNIPSSLPLSLTLHLLSYSLIPLSWPSPNLALTWP